MTEKQYLEATAIVERDSPKHPLLPTLRSGYSRINEIYLKHALAGAGRDESLAPMVNAMEPEPTDPVLRELWAEKGRLFRQMAKQSNHFHDCRSDEDRKNNSEEILRTWEAIRRVKNRIEWYEEHGEVPQQDERFPLPDDSGELFKKLASIRALVSQEQAKLKKLGQMPDGDPEKVERIRHSESRLAELKLYRGHAEQKTKGLPSPVHE